MHKIEMSCNRLSIEISFSRLLAEGVFVCNAFSFYNGVSPYNAVFGRQPACLPDLENIDFPKEGTNSLGEREQRIRQCAINAITQATAVGKLTTSLKGKTSEGVAQFKVGDMVDYHRDPSRKDDDTGWHGPF